ncbi:MAG TPA: alpha-hydroxy acid oxidase [Steroidobacteraceae bacterium]|nr:alpha-hydroxy acid oxidase [Steroidobacteraceae bacterium]
MNSTELARRNLLRYLLASPLFAGSSSLTEAFAQTTDANLDIEQALDVFDFEAIAKQKLPPAHWGYLATGVDAETTLAANRAGFDKYKLRMRRMIDIRSIDMSVNLFGVKWDSPIFLCPVSSLQAFHPEGEVGAAKAAAAKKHLQMCSTLSSYSIENVQEAHGGGVWFQLYATDNWDVTAALLKRAHAAGCPAVAVTADLNGGSNRETFARLRRQDKRDCTQCHQDRNGGSRPSVKANFRGIDMSKVQGVVPQTLTWDSVKRMRDVWPNKLLIKGIVTQEDAELAVRHGVDGIYVSNHGGRAEESGRGTIESLSEVVAGANKKIPVIIDSGFRRGTDIFKALALGATAVGVGRPYVWGLAANGQKGVEAVLNIQRRELSIVMRQAGTLNVSEITSASIVPPGK